MISGKKMLVIIGSITIAYFLINSYLNDPLVLKKKEAREKQKIIERDELINKHKEKERILDMKIRQQESQVKIVYPSDE